MMVCVQWFRRAFLSAVFLSLSSYSSAGVNIDRILPFTTSDSVTIEVAVFSDDAVTEITLTGKIVPEKGGPVLWEGTLGRTRLEAGQTTLPRYSISDLKPELWGPTSPSLYNLQISLRDEDRILAESSLRFGFRSFMVRDGVFYLNEKPIFLRGNAINPPGRDIPPEIDESREFIEDYLSYLKQQNVNIVRMSRHSDIWFDICDEVGMMVFQGRYGRPLGGSATKPPPDFEHALDLHKREVFEPLVPHPSVVIYVLSNETPAEEIPWLHGAKEYRVFLDFMYENMQEWDPTRAYIGNAGYGLGRSGNICDIHRYWGWYYGTFLNYFTLRDQNLFAVSGRNQPLTMTECVGNYTGVDGRFNLVSASKQPGAQKNWTGHAPNNEQGPRALRYQQFMMKQALEQFRRLRSVNPNLSGIMPFTIPFYNWNGIKRFDQMKPKPALVQMGISYQPVLLSWEMWTPQLYAGSVVNPIAHIVNDSDDRRDLTALELAYRISTLEGKLVIEARTDVAEVAYYETRAVPLSITLPKTMPTGDYVLEGTLMDGGEVVSRNTTRLFVARPAYAEAERTPEMPIAVYDPKGETSAALRRLGFDFKSISKSGDLNSSVRALIIGEGAWDKIIDGWKDLMTGFVRNGGRILCLSQDDKHFDSSWLPAQIEMRHRPIVSDVTYPPDRPFKDGMAVNPERPEHPVFDGIDRDRLFLWSDYTHWDQTRRGIPRVFPVSQGFTLADPSALANTAVLANYDHDLEGIALAEIFDGGGSVLVTGFDLIPRAGMDPVADRMLANLVTYAATREGHHAHPLIDSPIVWGNYQSERGLITGIYSGLLLNTVPIIPKEMQEKYPLVVAQKTGFQYAGSSGGWNSHPSVQFVARGRRAFGPYELSLGGRPVLPAEAAEHGTGTFWAKVPAGTKTVATKVENPHKVDGVIDVMVNGNRSAKPALVPAGTSSIIKCSIPDGATELAVTYSGDRWIVILETAFE